MVENSIAFITGAGDYLNLYSYLIDNGLSKEPVKLVLFGNGNNIPCSLRKIVEEMQQKTTGGLFHYLDTSKGLQGISELKDEVGSTYTKLFITHAFGKFETSIVNAFNYEELVLVENGIATYYPPLGRAPSLRQDYFIARPAFEVDTGWLPLAQFIGAPFYLDSDRIKFPAIESFQRAASDIASCNCVMPDKGKVLIVVGTSLYRLGVISEEDEIASYTDYIVSSLDSGFDKILWKPHPRMSVTKAKLPIHSSTIIYADNTLPLEIYFSSKANIQCASIASSALLFAKFYFGLQVHIIKSNLRDISRFPHIKKIREIAS